MGLLDGGIQIADNLLKSFGLECDITHRAYTGQNGYGTETYADAVTRKAVVDYTRKQRLVEGKLITVVATVTILEAVTANGATTNPPRSEPIDPRDIIVLPDGTTGPIHSVPDSVVNPATGRPFLNTIYLGEVSSAP